MDILANRSYLDKAFNGTGRCEFYLPLFNSKVKTIVGPNSLLNDDILCFKFMRKILRGP